MVVDPIRTSNIVLKASADSRDGTLPKSPPEGVPKGIFLHYVNDAWLPLLAEGVIWHNPALRNRSAQNTVSSRFNELEKKMMDASHLIPRTLGGSGETYNLVPLPSHFNQNLVRDFERKLEAMAKTKPYYLQAFVTYKGKQEVPREVTYHVYEMSGVNVLGHALSPETFWITH